MKKIDNPIKPEAIIITLPERFVKKYHGGELKLRKILERMNESDRYYWMNTCGSGIPKHKVEYCYLIWAGKIQYRFNINKYEKNVTAAFADGGLIREFENKNFVHLIGPVVAPERDYPMKGFQGFRYTEFLF